MRLFVFRDLVKDNLRLMRVLGETNSFMANHQSAFDKIISRQVGGLTIAVVRYWVSHIPCLFITAEAGSSSLFI